MKRLVSLFIAAVTISFAFAQETEAPPHLLVSNSVAYNYRPLKGKVWTALIEDGKGCSLHEEKVNVITKMEEAAEAPGLFPTDYIVFPKNKKILFMTDLLPPKNKCEKASYIEPKAWPTDQVVLMKLGEKNYDIKVSRKKNPPIGVTEIKDSGSFEISLGTNSQKLNVCDGGWSDDLPKIEWAGDVDGDGKLDFLFHEDCYVSVRYILYLSTKAKAGELVGKAAEYESLGC